jgi:hypothetical protein
MVSTLQIPEALTDDDMEGKACKRRQRVLVGEGHGMADKYEGDTEI